MPLARPPRRVLVLRFSSIGDIVLTTPVVRSLAQGLPGTQVHFATKAGFEPLLRHNPHIHRIHTLEPGGDAALIAELTQQDFDWVIDLHHNIRTLRIKLALGHVPSSTFPKLNVQKYLLTRFKINRMPNVHIVERYAEALCPLGVGLDDGGLEMHPGPEAEAEARATFAAAALPGSAYAAVLGANYATKQYPPDLMARLLNTLSQPVVLLGGPAERTYAEYLTANLTVPFHDAVARHGLLASAALMRHCQAVITGDTGFMHIAAAFAQPVHSIWGNTVPELGMYPYRTPHNIFEIKELNCRPCSKLGYKACPKGHFRCMRDQVPEVLAEQIANS